MEHLTSWSYNPNLAETRLVWAVPISLAATNGITFVFFSSGYLDVSVLRVCFHQGGYYVFNIVGCPIRTSTDHSVCATPRSFSQLITSFIASASQGIRRLLLITFLRRLLYMFIPICQRTLLWRISESNRWPLECKSSALASWANSPFCIYL